MKIGIFGGSFDPVHNEHIAVAKASIRSLSLDKLFIVPAHTPPHKKGKVISSDKDRLAMCRLAFSGLDKVEVSTFETDAGGTSYTYLTCRHFKEKYENSTVFFIVGTDMLRDFPTWKNPKDILQTATLAVCARNEYKDWLEKEKQLFYDAFHTDFAVIDYNGKPVSSTKIRVLATAGYDLTDFLPVAVNEYIAKNGLYAVEGVRDALCLESEKRREHSIRVAMLCAERAPSVGVLEKDAILSGLMHDCAKNLPVDSPYLDGFIPPCDVPPPVLHQYQGAYVAEKRFGITDEDVLNAIRFHTSGRQDMSVLEKLVFLADLVEEGRDYEGVEVLRALFWQDLDACMAKALEQTLSHLRKTKKSVYPLTERAYEYYRR